MAILVDAILDRLDVTNRRKAIAVSSSQGPYRMVNIPGYTLQGAIRSTGSNRLFHVVSDAHGTPLVLKTPGASGSDPHALARYRREFSILQRLRGVRGVTRAHACEVLQDRPVLLLEKVEGKPLSELVGRPLEVCQVLELALSLVSTLVEVHRRGVIHKDIKPSNIMVTPSGVLPRSLDGGNRPGNGPTG